MGVYAKVKSQGSCAAWLSGPALTLLLSLADALCEKYMACFPGKCKRPGTCKLEGATLTAEPAIPSRLLRATDWLSKPPEWDYVEDGVTGQNAPGCYGAASAKCKCACVTAQ